MTSTASTVHSALRLLRRPAALMGFEASRHEARGSFGAPDVLIVDMPIAEETMVGAALGLAIAGRDVVVDVMFEGFLSRCLEPLRVGLPTAEALTGPLAGRIVLRALGGPIDHGGPSHSLSIAHFLAGEERIGVVHVEGPEDVAWAIAQLRRYWTVAVLIDPATSRDEPTPAPINPGEGRAPLRHFRFGASELVVCANSVLPALLLAIGSGALVADLLATPASCIEAAALAKVVERYEKVELRGVRVV